MPTPRFGASRFLMAIPVASLCLGGAHARVDPVRLSRFFQVDLRAKKILDAAPHVDEALRLDLASVSVDQPQYWPQESVHLKVLAPGRPRLGFTARLQKRDAQSRDLKGALDPQGVAVLPLMSGEKSRLELGEWRVDVRADDGRSLGHTTFAVVEGTLGAVSLAHEFKQVTSVKELETSGGAWFMGNAAGAGKRWGNGLSFRNELRVANQPYNGEVQCISRCMLPGCNGVQAGPTQHLHSKHGVIEGTMDVGGHSGPFQIELVTPKGSLRHQFEGSSHVERDMVQASAGVTFTHRAGLAPYQGTVQVPGRQIFVETEPGRAHGDAFVIDSIIANDGQLTVRTAKDIHSPVIHVWHPTPEGKFVVAPTPLGSTLASGREVQVKVTAPYAFVTLGGFVDGRLVEGWTLAFAPAGFTVAFVLPPSAGPGMDVPVEITARDHDQRGLAVSGVLEVYDNRVASRSPMTALASSLGDSFRNTSASVSRWQDRTGIDDEKPRTRTMEKDDAPVRLKEESRSLSPAGNMRAAPEATRPMSSAKRALGAGQSGRAVHFSDRSSSGDEVDAPEEVIREGDQKVMYVGVVQLDAGGRATVSVKMPPQIGRVSFRFVGVNGLEHAAVQQDVDVKKSASVEPHMPRTFVPGASLTIRASVVNNLQEVVSVNVSGTGMGKTEALSFGTGAHEMSVSWYPEQDGKVIFSITRGRKVLDRREVEVRSVSSQRVTYSRLLVASGSPIALAPAETAVVYAGPGALMRGMVMNMVTTMQSWFGHAEALSAQVAAKAVILAAIGQGIIDDEGLEHTLQADVDKTVRDLAEVFLDAQTDLVRPYPGVAPQPLWSAWVSHNLHKAVHVLRADSKHAAVLQSALTGAEAMAMRIDSALATAGFSLEQQGGYDIQGMDVIPVEIDGKVVYRVLTDQAVTRWALDQLLPALDTDAPNAERSFSVAYDRFRFLRAFQKSGALQYLTDIAKGLYINGEWQKFTELYAILARGMIMAQEPGMLQGPAVLGGVYSTPMAMVRFLELLLMMAQDEKTPRGEVQVLTAAGPRTVPMGQQIGGEKGGSLVAPPGAVVRVDSKGWVHMRPNVPAETAVTVELSSNRIKTADEGVISITLDGERNPLEYYALIAVPSTLAIKQTEDILSDYQGQLIYGQQAMGGAKMQFVAVPFRGSRQLRLLVEGAFSGSSEGVVAIRHIENVTDAQVLRIPAVVVP
jgi:hypothetical protein